VRRGSAQTLVTELEKRGDDEEAVTQFGIDYATTQCQELLRQACPGFIFTR